MTDLSNFKPTSDEVKVELVNPKTGEPLLNDDDSPMVITLYAQHTKEYKEVQYDMTDDLIAKADGNKIYRPKAKEVADRTLTIFAKITKSWNITYNGKKPRLTFEKAYQIYDDLPFVKQQLEEGLDKTEGFT